MRVRFEFTVEDLVDVGERTVSRSSVVLQLRRTAVWIWSVAAGLLALAAVPLPWPGRLASAAGAAGIVAAVYPRFRRAAVADRLKAYWKERLAGGGPFTCDVELDATGITVEQFGTKSTVAWPDVRSVADTPDSVEIATRRGSLVVVRNRAFPTPDERARFLAFARERIAGAAPPPPALAP